MVTRGVALLALEILFILTGLVGVALVHFPTALILAGILGVLAVERNGGDET